MTEALKQALIAVEQAARDSEEQSERIIDIDFEDFDFESPFWADNCFHDDLPSAKQEPEPNKFPGFCCGCGAHHVREPGRMLCTDCNEEFRDIG